MTESKPPESEPSDSSIAENPPPEVAQAPKMEQAPKPGAKSGQAKSAGAKSAGAESAGASEPGDSVNSDEGRDPDPDPTSPTVPRSKLAGLAWAVKSRLKSLVTPGKLAVIGCSILIIGAVAWYSRGPEPSETAQPLDLSDSIRFSEEIERILAGKTTRLSIVDFEVNDSMLDAIPIEQLRAAKQKAIEVKDRPIVDQDGEGSAPKIYNEEGKRINFDRPAWKDYVKIDTVLIDQGIVSNEGVAKIAQLPDLEHVRLRLSPITDEAIQPLLQCQELWLLNLPHSQLTNDGIRSLAKLRKLRQLRLGSTLLTNDCCRAIAELEGLRGLHLIGIPITDEGVKVLSELPHLESLYIDDSAVTDSGWDWVFRNHPQLHVHINQRHHDRDPQSHVH